MLTSRSYISLTSAADQVNHVLPEQTSKGFFAKIHCLPFPHRPGDGEGGPISREEHLLRKLVVHQPPHHFPSSPSFAHVSRRKTSKIRVYMRVSAHHCDHLRNPRPTCMARD